AKIILGIRLAAVPARLLVHQIEIFRLDDVADIVGRLRIAQRADQKGFAGAAQAIAGAKGAFAMRGPLVPRAAGNIAKAPIVHQLHGFADGGPACPKKQDRIAPAQLLDRQRPQIVPRQGGIVTIRPLGLPSRRIGFEPRCRIGKDHIIAKRHQFAKGPGHGDPSADHLAQAIVAADLLRIGRGALVDGGTDDFAFLVQVQAVLGVTARIAHGRNARPRP
ncbi:hypothetical protein E4T56_gene15794, partial [Termitomyces sp. T112]